MLADTGAAPLNCTLSLTSASLPVVPDICSSVDGVRKGDGSTAWVATLAPPVAPWTSTYWPGATVKSGSGALIQVPVPVAEAYCRLQPLAVMLVLPRLNNSM